MHACTYTHAHTHTWFNMVTTSPSRITNSPFSVSPSKSYNILACVGGRGWGGGGREEKGGEEIGKKREGQEIQFMSKKIPCSHSVYIRRPNRSPGCLSCDLYITGVYTTNVHVWSCDLYITGVYTTNVHVWSCDLYITSVPPMYICDVGVHTCKAEKCPLLQIM